MTSTIKAMDKRTRHEPQADYWDSYWDNLVFKLQTEKATKRQFSNWLEKLKLFFRIEPRLVFQLAGATALILLGVLIGKFYFQRSTPLEFQATVR